MKKIIAIVAVIATITAVLCIGTNAYNNGDIIKAGTEITWKDTLNLQSGSNTIYMQFESNGISCTNVNIGPAAGGLIRYATGPTTYITYMENGVVINEEYKTIILTEDFTVNGSFITFISNNVIIKEPSPVKDTLSNTKATFATTLTVATAIIAWLMANQIALVGLYMYILITLVLIGKRYIKGV